MAEKYKLSYFNLRGIAEPIRFMFKYLNIPFENEEIDCTVWDDIKPSVKWEQLPHLEYNGKLLTQSTAITRFIATKHNLLPEDPWEDAKCEEVIGAIHDLRIILKPAVLLKFAGDGDKFEEQKQEMLASKVPLFLGLMNGVLEEFRGSSSNDKGENATLSDFILGKEKPTSADFWLAHFTDQWICKLLDASDLLGKYDLLRKQKEAVFKLPQVEKHIESRHEAFI